MNKNTRILIAVLAIFVVGMTLSIAFAEPVSAEKYKNKSNITVTVKDGKKTIRINCKYDENCTQYLGQKEKYGKTYDVSICYEEKDGMQMGKKGWWTCATNGGMIDGAKMGYEYNENHPVVKVKLH